MNTTIKILLVLACLLQSFLSNALEFKTKDFTVIYDTNVPINVIEKLAIEIEHNIKIVQSYLKQSKEYEGTPIKERLLVYISKTKRIPYQDWNTIHIPENRVLNAFGKGQKHEGLAIIHELTHVYAVSAFRNKKTKPNLVQIYHRKTPSLGETTG